MKLDFLQQLSGNALRQQSHWRVSGETDRLTDVLLSPPQYLAPVPCCAATIESLASGFQTDRTVALAEHRQLRETLKGLGIRCHLLPPAAGMPDLCFTRDTAVTTPWGALILNPALSHRQREVDHVEHFLRSAGIDPIGRIRAGTVEGGDVCIAREGLLIVGSSGDRTNAEGVRSLASWFEPHGWEVLVSPFAPEHLHLDTIFCMLDARHALACLDALDPAFVKAVEARGIELISVDCSEARGLGGNILSIDGRTILVAAGQQRLARAINDAGFTTIAQPISQFAACGGGLHCLTMPLARG